MYPSVGKKIILCMNMPAGMLVVDEDYQYDMCICCCPRQRTIQEKAGDVNAVGMVGKGD